MKHLLGMVKSFRDLKGARGPELELDYLRLVYAVSKLRSAVVNGIVYAKTGDEAQGYLGVLNQEISERVKRWENKYGGKDFVKAIKLDLSKSVMTQLQKEKTNNWEGVSAAATGGKASSLSKADFSRKVTEEALRGAILKSEPRAKQIEDKSRFPLDVEIA